MSAVEDVVWLAISCSLALRFYLCFVILINLITLMQVNPACFLH